MKRTQWWLVCLMLGCSSVVMAQADKPAEPRTVSQVLNAQL